MPASTSTGAILGLFSSFVKGAPPLDPPRRGVTDPRRSASGAERMAGNPEHQSPYLRRLVAAHEDSIYHITSRICSDEKLMDPGAQFQLIRVLHEVAFYCGISLINYATF